MGNFLDKVPQDTPPHPPKLYKKLGILQQQIFCTDLRGGPPPSKLYKTPSKGGSWLVKVKLLKLCRQTRSYPE